MTNDDDFELIIGEVMRVTEKAVLLDVGDREIWIPRSLIDSGEEITVQPFAQQEFYVAQWFVDKEGL